MAVSTRDEDRRILANVELSHFRIMLAASFLLVVGAVWTATATQSECESMARQAFFGYTEALNSGEAATAASWFTDSNNFSWFSEDPDRLGEEARDRGSLLGYLNERVADDARLRVLFFDFNGGRGTLGQFGFTAFNESWRLVSGKGAVSCATGKITVLSIGGA